MTAWRPPPLDEAALAAIAALERPSRPRPLSGSARVGPRAWRIALAPEAVLAAYAAPDAPVPNAATTRTADGTLVVSAAFGETCVLVVPAGTGSEYRLVPGPTLTVDGSGVPAGPRYAAVGCDRTDLSTGKPQLSVAALLEEGEQLWLFMGTQSDDDGRQVAFLEPVDRRTLPSVSLPEGASPAPATVVADGEKVVVRFRRGRKPVSVTATPTHTLVELMRLLPAPPPLDPAHRLRCVTKASTGPMDQRIRGVGGVVGDAPWRLTAAELIARLDAGETFYVQESEGDDPVFVVVATGTSDTRYPMARRAGERANLVLGLPRCRAVGHPPPLP